MTDRSPTDPGPVDPDVELASAHLDGEAGPDERAQEQAVADQVAAFGRIADQVRDVPPAPPGLVDDHVARALAAFDDEARITPIGRARSATSWWQRIPLGAVAAVLVVIAFVGLASLAPNDEDDTASTSLDSAEDSGGDAASTGAAEETMAADAADDGAALESAPAGGGAGGGSGRQTFADYDELATALRDELVAPSIAASTDQAGAESPASEREAEGADTDEALDPCGAVQVAGIDPATVVLVRRAFVDPGDVTAVVHDDADGRRLTVVEHQTCTVVVDRLL